MPPAATSAPRSGRGRLSRSAEFDRVFRHGRSYAGREFVLYVFARADENAAPRLGLSVSRKVGGAVDRNRVKCLVREAFAQEGLRLPAATDAVVIARQSARELAARCGLRGIQDALGELIDRVPGVAVSSGVDGEAAGTGDGRSAATQDEAR